MNAPRIAIGGFLHETNTFAPSRATYSDFVSGSGQVAMATGDQIVSRLAGINLGVSGALEHAAAHDWTLLPTLWAMASPSAHVEEDAFERIAEQLLKRLSDTLPVDGVFLDLHGAMVCTHIEDGEGELLDRVRALIGVDTPLVASLDLHANVTERMVEAADLLESYRTYPHIDMAATGTRAAACLGAMLGTRWRPDKAFRCVPYLMPTVWQCTEVEPARTLYAILERLARKLDTASLNMGFPAADFPGCAPTVLAYGEGAEAAADALLTAVLNAEPDFVGEVLTPDAAVARALEIARSANSPVIIADTQDNPGAGGDSDTTGLARALIAASATDAALGCIVDPEAALAAHAAGAGATLRLALGGRSAIPGDAPLEADFTVMALGDGRLRADGPYFGGTEMALGPCACLRTGGVDLVITTGKVQAADRALFRHVGIVPEERPILGVKSSVHFRADFEPQAAAILITAAPGPMAVDPAALPWTRLAPETRVAPLCEAFGKRCPTVP